MVSTAYEILYDEHEVPTAIGRRELTTDALGHVWTRDYDLLDRLEDELDPLDRRTSYEYDAVGRLTETVGPAGVKLHLAYDEIGRVLKASQVQGELDRYDGENDDLVTTYKYDALGRVTEVSVWETFDAYWMDPNEPVYSSERLSQTLFQYDVYGNVTESRQVIGNLDNPDSWGEPESNDVVTSYAYDQTGRLLVEVVWVGYAPVPGTPGLGWHDELFAAGSLAEFTPLSLTVYGYDELGRLTKTTRVVGAVDAVVNADRDAFDELDPTNDEFDDLVETIAYAFDSTGTSVAVTDARGETWTTFYDPLGRVVRTVDPLSNETTYVYDAVGRLTDENFPEGKHAHYGYDALDRLTEVRYVKGLLDGAVDPLTDLSNTETDDVVYGTAYEFDAVGTRLIETDSLGQARTSHFDHAGRLVRLVDRDGSMTKYDYDAAGRLKATTQVLGGEDGPGGPATADERDRVVKYAHNDVLRTETVTYVQGIDDADPDRSTLDPLDPADRVVVTTRDENGRVESVNDSQAGLTEYTYRADGRVATIDAVTLDRQTAYTYDDLGRVTTIADSVMGTTTFTYDKLSHRTSLTDATANTTSWTYDQLGLLIVETDPLNAERSFAYDRNGNLVRAVDRTGRVTDYVYDAANRRTHEYWFADATAAPADPVAAGGSTVSALRTFTFAYDEANRLESAADSGDVTGAANSYAYHYDVFDRIERSVFASAGVPSFTLDYVFDENGNRKEQRATLGTTDDFVNLYDYDELDRLQWLTQAGQTGGAAVNSKRVDYTYDELGRMQTIVRSSDLAGTNEVATTSYVFDQLDRLRELTHLHGATVLDAYGWTYDAFDRLETFTSTTTGTTTYQYDAADQLLGADRTGTTDDETYTYDENGNRTDDGFTTTDGHANRMSEDTTFTLHLRVRCRRQPDDSPS